MAVEATATERPGGAKSRRRFIGSTPRPFGLFVFVLQVRACGSGLRPFRAAD
jgi:hypothetical protein